MLQDFLASCIQRRSPAKGETFVDDLIEAFWSGEPYLMLLQGENIKMLHSADEGYLEFTVAGPLGLLEWDQYRP